MRPGEHSNAAVRKRYGRLAPIYDWANLEPFLYAKARTRAIELLDLRPGARVLDLACGTGVNFGLIEQRIGPSGSLVGVDFTPAMLGRARARAADRGWRNVRLYESDASRLKAQRLENLGALERGERFDAALCTLALSVIPDWERAWTAMLSVVRPGAKVAVMDAGHPETPTAPGKLLAARPVAWSLSRFFTAACSRRPWELVARDTDKPALERFTWNYVVAAAGDVRVRDATLAETADRQISDLIAVLSTAGNAAVALTCPSRDRLGDGTVGAIASHLADNYIRIAAFVQTAGDARAAGAAGHNTRKYNAENVDLDELLGRLSRARDALAVMAELSDEQLNAVPAASEMKFCDGQRTLEQILSSLFKHQRHQVDAVRAGCDRWRRDIGQTPGEDAG